MTRPDADHHGRDGHGHGRNGHGRAGGDGRAHDTVLSDADFSDPGSPGPTGRFTHAPDSRPLDGYTIKRAIHRGGFGEVYYGLSDGGKEVAMKLLHQHCDVELRGANACLNLNHPNLVTIFDIKREPGGDWWVLMEYAGGPRLADVIEDRGSLPVEEIEHWLRGIVAGLSFLHERGLVHRDLKPANIFAEGGTVKVGDVGLSKFVSESRASAHTRSVGTVYYMAPEVSRGRYGRGVDVYALAVMLFEMYTGKVPFDGETPAEILMKHLSAPPDLSALPTNLRPVFARALHKDPEQRTCSAAELERQFRAAVRGQRTDDAPADLNAGAPVVDSPAEPVRRAERPAPRPAPVPKPASKKDEGDGFATAVKWTAFAVVLVAIFSPRALAGLSASIWEIGILGGLGYGVYRVVKFLAGADHAPPPSSLPPAESAPPRRAVAVNYVAPPRPQPRRRTPRPVPLGPEDARDLSRTRRVTEFAGSAVVAAVLSAAVAGLLAATGALPTFAAAVLFGVVCTGTVWAVLGLSKGFEGTDVTPTARRLTTAAVGAGLGVGAWALADALLVDVPLAGDSALREVIGSRAALPVAGWVGYFALLLGGRRWWRHADGFRPKRLRVRTVLATFLVGAAATAVFGVPAELGLPWAAATSVVAQLAAVWTPAKRRPRKVPVTA